MYTTKSHLFANKVNDELDVFHPAVMDGLADR
jgi:hypothetical protein